MAHKLKELVCLFLKEYSILANAADKDKKLLFSVAPKFHLLWHLGARAVFLNPRKGCTMLDEDYMGECREIVAAAVHGTVPHSVPQKFLEKYCCGKSIMLLYGD